MLVNAMADRPNSLASVCSLTAPISIRKFMWMCASINGTPSVMSLRQEKQFGYHSHNLEAFWISTLGLSQGLACKPAIINLDSLSEFPTSVASIEKVARRQAHAEHLCNLAYGHTDSCRQIEAPPRKLLSLGRSLRGVIHPEQIFVFSPHGQAYWTTCRA